jgi:hypothetical protein
MDGSDSASSCSVRRGRRPHGTPRNFMHENRETSEIPVANLSDRTAGEGLGRTARMHVTEESHRGIVPMNHSNKDGASSAESEEGRLRLKENLSHLTHTRLSAGLRVSHGWASVRTSDTLAAIHLREEPDALISARPGLYGGQPAMVVPTVIDNYPSDSSSTSWKSSGMSS